MAIWAPIFVMQGFAGLILFSVYVRWARLAIIFGQRLHQHWRMASS